MNAYTGSIPDTLERTGRWVLQAICRTDPDVMFPDNNTRGIADAKAVCAMCPDRIRTACLVDALDTDDNEFGIRGGFTPQERRAIRKTAGGRYADLLVLARAIVQVQHPATAGRSLRDVWEEHTYPLKSGHLAVRGSRTISYQGRSYAANWVSWTIDRDRKPVGQVRRTCDVDGCVHPQHLADNYERHILKAGATA